MLVTHSEQNVGVAERLRCLERKYVALLIDITERWNNFSVGLDCQPSQTGIAPGRRIFLTKPKFMVVTNGDFRPVWRAQAQFNPRVSAIDVHFGVWRIEKHIVMWKEAGIAIVPSAKFRVTSLDVTEARFR